MSLSTYLLEYGRHVARLRRRRRRRRRAYAPTSNTASHDNHKKILHGFPFLSRDDYGAPLGGPSGRRSSAIKILQAFSISLSFLQFVKQADLKKKKHVAKIYTVNLRISARGAYFKSSRRQGALIRGGRLLEGGAYLIFPKWWPDMITFLIHHLRINTNISCLLT